MASLNKVFLMGRLGADPELRYTESGTALGNMSLATSNYNSKTKKEETTWHKIVAFSKTAEVCKEHLHKGSSVLIEGRIQNRSYEKDGQTRYVSEVIADRVQFLGGNGKKKDETVEKPTDQSDKSEPFGDDKPF